MTCESMVSEVGSQHESIHDEKCMIEWIQCRIKAAMFDVASWTDCHSDIVREFLLMPSTVSLFITVDQHLNHLIVCCGAPPEPSAGRMDVTYFVKADGEILSPSTMDKIIFGTIAMRQDAASVLHMMETVLYPNIFQNSKWNKSSKQELLGLYHRFMASLTESANEESGRTKLYLPSTDDSIVVDRDGSTHDMNVIHQLEAIAIHWIRQIKEALSYSEHNISFDYQHGPMDELKFWEDRAEDLDGISKQLQSPEVVHILNSLKIAKSKYLKPLEDLTATLWEGTMEASSSVKFLMLLKSPCEQLPNLNVTTGPSIMMKFLNCIRLIHFHSKNYSTLEKISDLSRRVSSEIVQTCANQISSNDILFGDLLKARSKLHECIKLCYMWKQSYNRMAITVNRFKEHNGLSSDYWKANDPSIFVEIDIFVQRCDDLIDICGSRVQFQELLYPNVLLQSPDGRMIGGPNGPEIENSIKLIQDGFRMQIERLSKLDYSILHAQESRWHSDYNAFKFAVKDLEAMLIKAIDNTFEDIEVVQTAAYFIQSLQKLAHRPAIKSCSEKKAMALRVLFMKECQRIRREFDHFHRHPPLRISEPPYAGPALWIAALSASLENDWRSIYDVSGNSQYDDNLEVVYSDLFEALSLSQKQKYEDWFETLCHLDSAQLQNMLDQPILRKSERTKDDSVRRIESNFNSHLLSILSETIFWEKLRSDQFITPTEILGVVHQRHSLYHVRELVNTMVRAYNDLVQDLKGTGGVYLDHQQLVKRKCRPAFNKIFWSTKTVVIEKFVQDVLLDIRNFHRQVREFHCGIHRIKQQCKIISETFLIRASQKKNYDKLSFESVQEKHRSQGQRIILACHEVVTLELNSLSKQFDGKSKEVQREWISYMMHIDEMILQALLNCTRLSLNEFETIISGKHNHGGNDPTIFSTVIELQNGEIICRPSLISITTSMNKVAKHTVNVMRQLDRVSPDQAQNVMRRSFYDIIRSDDIVLNKIICIMNQMASCARKVQEELFLFHKYRCLWNMDKISYLRRYSKTSERNFEIDVKKFKSMYESVQEEKSFRTVGFIQLDFSSLQKELCSLASYFQHGLLNILEQTTTAKVAALIQFVDSCHQELRNSNLGSISHPKDRIQLINDLKERCIDAQKDIKLLRRYNSILDDYDKEDFDLEIRKIETSLTTLTEQLLPAAEIECTHLNIALSNHVE